MTVKLLDKIGLKSKGIGWNASTLWRKMVSGEFPKAVIVGNKNFWIEAEVDDYIAGLIAKRDTRVDGHAAVGDGRNLVGAA
jgi:predicted DNA-binding transcriptional regulator AlpA